MNLISCLIVFPQDLSWDTNTLSELITHKSYYHGQISHKKSLLICKTDQQA